MGTVIIETLSRPPVRLGRFTFARPVMLAPMSGVTDLPFRRLAASFGADLVVTEMVASESFRKGAAEMSLRSAGQGLRPHMVQLAGREATWMGEAARMAEANGADIIDINMGCPARRVTTGWSGAALMRDLDHALTLIEATVAAVKLPVTLKMRLGWDRGSINAPELARRAEDAGVQMVTVHGRTRDQFYEGRADWAAIRRVRAVISVPLIANGDVCGFDDADEILAQSGADGVMIGRGACGRPWLPAAVSRYFATGERDLGPQADELIALVVAHHQALVAHYGAVKGVLAARKHLAWYIEAEIERRGLGAVAAGHMRLATARRALMSAIDPATIESLIGDVFDVLAEMRTNVDASGRAGGTQSTSMGSSVPVSNDAHHARGRAA
jgi:nifR3 family TIM-barrel protein